MLTAPTVDNFSFDKNQRLLKPNEFKVVFNRPIKKIHSPHFLLFIAHTQHPTTRLGMAITKKKLKRATDRNQLKRHTREIFRLKQHQLPALDCVLIVKSNAFLNTHNKKQAWQNAKAELIYIFTQLHTTNLHTS